MNKNTVKFLVTYDVHRPEWVKDIIIQEVPMSIIEEYAIQGRHWDPFGTQGIEDYFVKQSIIDWIVSQTGYLVLSIEEYKNDKKENLQISHR